MYKLVILVPPLDNQAAFDDAWPRFLHLVESMAELRREATSRVDTVLYGAAGVSMTHELFFDSQEAAHRAMASPEGLEAGRLLQAMTAGQVTLFLADHKEDDLSNIRKYKKQARSGASPAQQEDVP